MFPRHRVVFDVEKASQKKWRLFIFSIEPILKYIGEMLKKS
ncbi:unnamed protein product, partial [marine sediment metagenome]